MNKIRVLVFVILITLILAGCKGGSGKDETAGAEMGTAAESGNTESEAPDEKNADTGAPADSKAADDKAADNASADTDAAAMESAGQESGTASETVRIDYPFEERFIYGNKNLFYIEDDGSLTCVFMSKKDQTIEYGQGAYGQYFFLVNSEDGKNTLYFFDRDFKLSFTPIDYENMYIKNITPHEGMVYFSGYDSSLQKDDILYYDPEGDGFNHDPETGRLTNLFENYKGIGLIKLAQRYDIIRDMEITRNIYMKDPYTNEIYVFDEKGNEIKVMEAVKNGGTAEYYGPGYLVIRIENIDKEFDGEVYVLYDVNEEKQYRLNIGQDSEDSGIVDLRDGFLYYYTDNPGGVYKEREYRRIAIDDIKNGDNLGEKLLVVDVYPTVNSSYGSYSQGNNKFDAFTVKKDRVYYLAFDEKGTDGRKGDVVWKCVPLEGTSGGSIQATGAVERHEAFADFGTITVEKDYRAAEEDKDFNYFTGEYQKFRFYEDIENADLMNKELEEIDKTARKYGDEVASTAKREIIDQAEEGNDISWFKEFIGQGYSYENSFGGITRIGEDRVQIEYYDYSFYGGAHGMGGSSYYLFNLKTGKRETIKDLYKGSEQEFKEIALDYSISDWKNGNNGYYESYDGTNNSEEEMRKTFSEYISLDMPVTFSDYSLSICYPTYSVGPYASGEIKVEIPYFALNIEV